MEATKRFGEDLGRLGVGRKELSLRASVAADSAHLGASADSRVFGERVGTNEEDRGRVAAYLVVWNSGG
ncbi:hypothetical protein ACU8V6_00030 [Vibrio alginolyticus]